MDKSRHYEDPKAVAEYENGIVLGSDVIAQIMAALENKGYKLAAHPEGVFCGFKVYKKTQALVDGLDAPKDFYRWTVIDAEDELSRCAFLTTFRATVENLIAVSDEQEKKLLIQYLFAMCDRFRDRKNNALLSVASGLWGQDKLFNKVTLNGSSGFTKVVPLKQWFPANVQAIDPRSLLTLFPDAEAKMFMLILGRLMAGPKNSQTAEGLLQHAARSFALVVGLEAGMGKSTLMGYLRSALGKLGYTHEMLNTDFDRFGWGRVAEADLALVDDLTNETQEKLIRSDKVKSIVSNDVLQTQEKGEHSRRTQSRCVLIGCTNVHNPAHFISLDEGSINRLNQLYTYTKWELEEVYGKGSEDTHKILPYWENLATELGTSTDVLAAWLLRGCLDLFLETTGHYFNEQGQLCKERSKDTLEYTVRDLRSQFKIESDLKHVKELVTACGELCAIAVATCTGKEQERLVKGYEHTDFIPELLLHVLSIFIDTPELPEPWDVLNLNSLSRGTAPYIKNKMTDLGKLKSVKSMSDAFTIIIKELKSNKGFGYPTAIAAYSADWFAVKNQMAPRIRYWTEVLKEHELPKCVDTEIDGLKSLIKKMAG